MGQPAEDGGGNVNGEDNGNDERAPEALSFSRRDPQTYVLLISRAGPDGVLLGTRFAKPPGTEYAQPEDLADAGYVSQEWRELALAALRELYHGDSNGKLRVESAIRRWLEKGSVGPNAREVEFEARQKLLAER
jgi:hypothetical protein